MVANTVIVIRQDKRLRQIWDEPPVMVCHRLFASAEDSDDICASTAFDGGDVLISFAKTLKNHPDADRTNHNVNLKQVRA